MMAVYTKDLTWGFVTQVLSEKILEFIRQLHKERGLEHGLSKSYSQTENMLCENRDCWLVDIFGTWIHSQKKHRVATI